MACPLPVGTRPWRLPVATPRALLVTEVMNGAFREIGLRGNLDAVTLPVLGQARSQQAQ